MEWDMRWGMAPLPRDAQSATLTLVDGYFISAQTQHPEACWNWISFLSTQLPALRAPVRRSLAESDEYERQVGAQVAAVVRASIEDALLLSPELAEFEDALDLFGQAFEAIFSGRSTPEEAMSWAQQQSRFK
jgi:ABC-type glycerol-3-phosphate transport system substrate-binding protein